MQRLTSAICTGLILATWLPFDVAQPAAQEIPQELQGAWTAVRAQRDGKAADDVVGHRLALADNRFQIHAKDGKLLYAGTFSVQPNARPAAIDFEHTQAPLKGQSWKGIFALDGNMLIIGDNAVNPDKPRPDSFETRSGSGYVVITFQRAKP